MNKRFNSTKPLGLVIILIFSIVAYVYGRHKTPQEIREWAILLRTHPAGLPVFVVFSIVICFVNVPLGVLAKLTSGWLFGFLPGALISHSSILLGSWLAFRTARFFGKDYVEEKWKKQTDWLDHHLRESQLMSVIRFRIFPLIPLPVANFCLGISRVTDRNFLLGGLVGMLPAALFYAFIGSRLYDDSIETFNLAGFKPYYVYLVATLTVSWAIPKILRKTDDIKPDQL